MTENEQRDQIARDGVNKALAAIERHEAVCLEQNKEWERFRAEVREGLKLIQGNYEIGMHDMKSRIEGTADRINVDAQFLAMKNHQATINQDIYAKLWAALIAWALLMTAISGGLAAKAFHLVQ